MGKLREPPKSLSRIFTDFLAPKVALQSAAVERRGLQGGIVDKRTFCASAETLGRQSLCHNAGSFGSETLLPET